LRKPRPMEAVKLWRKIINAVSIHAMKKYEGVEI
jgi:hypothetical protein